MMYRNFYIDHPFDKFHFDKYIDRCIYTDGGVMLKNPSDHGGMWAWVRADFQEKVSEDSGLHLGPSTTNNFTEMLAAIEALKSLEYYWSGLFCSDSQITLRRLFTSSPWKGIPNNLLQEYKKQKARLIHWDKIVPVLLNGHPTQQELKNGFGKRGYPASKWNVYVDEKCQEIGKQYISSL